MASTFSQNLKTRRDLLRRGLALGVCSPTLGMFRSTRHVEAQVAGVELPPDVGQTSLQVFVPETQHTIRGTFLDYWRAKGAAWLFGNPISEPFASSNGYYSQAFERGVLQYRPEYLWSEEPVLRMMPIYQILASPRRSGFDRSDRRMNGGGQLTGPAWIPLDSSSRRVVHALEQGGRFYETTGHTLTGSLLKWYDDHEGAFYLGAPVTEAFYDRGMRTQFFESGRLIKTANGIRLADLDRAVVRDLEIDVSGVDRGDLPEFDELLFIEAPNPIPLGELTAPGCKRIEISLSEQRLWAYHGETLITSTLVSTGLTPNETERGLFRLRLKYPLQDMQGFTDSTGEVLGTGEAPDGMVPYSVEDVPHVMYFNLQAEALHGAYWHDNFGTPMSHGCVNLPLDMAAFLYGWAPLGTTVWVHD